MTSTISRTYAPRSVFSRLSSVLALAASTLLPGLAPSLWAQTSAADTATAVQAAAVTAARSVRITGPIDDQALVTLKGNVHPQAQARFDQGAAPASMPTGRLSLVLAPSALQQQALHQYLDSLQNHASPNYHKWLTPAGYAAAFGASNADIATISAWLNGKGFKVEKVAAAHNLIQFSGTVSQVQEAFHTSIHSYLVNGERHFANSSEPAIPAALAAVVSGVGPLNDFHPRASSRVTAKAAYDPASKRFKPTFTLFDSNNVPTLFVDPADAAIIYNTPNSTLNPSYSGTTYDGTGVTIGIAGDSDFTAQDVLNYRSLFLNDPDPSHVPTTIIDGDDPGINGDEIEALLDTEILGGIAPGAQINFYTAADTDLSQGLFLSIERAINDNAVSILNISFGECEARLGQTGSLMLSNLWEEAAAQGISVTVSTGDNGSAGCDNPNPSSASESLTASKGLAVSGFASTPYNIAVGGTDFQLSQSNFTQYVQDQNSGNPPYYATALGFIPEVPWNDSVDQTSGFPTIAQSTPYLDKGVSNISAASGGISAFFPKPSYQSALTPNDGARDLPDVSLLAANGLYGALWAFCSDSVANGDTTTYTDCQLTNGQPTSSTQYDGVGGTSASAPAFAGMLALVSQSLGTGTRLGQVNPTLYNLANTEYSTVFHDVTEGNNSVLCAQGSTPDCVKNTAGYYFLTGYDAATGYDLASGLGSVNAANMTSDWTNAGLLTPTVSLTANGGTSAINITHGNNVTFAVTLAPTAATGDVSIDTTSGVTNNVAITGTTISGGTALTSVNSLPGGSYSVYAYYGGDTTYVGAPSNSIDVVVGKEDSNTSLSVNAYDASTGNALNSATFPYGSYAFADAQPYGISSVVSGNTITPDGIPTGTVAFTNFSDPAAASVSINAAGAAQYAFYALAPGTYSVTAQYSGDVSFNASSSSAQSFTITKGATQINLTTATATAAAAPAFKPGAAAKPAKPISQLLTAGGGVALGCLLLLSVPARRRAWRSMVGMLALVAAIGTIGISGCGGGSSSSGGGGGGGSTGMGTYTVMATLETDSYGAYPTGAITLTGHGNTFTAASTATGTITDGTVAVQAVFTVPGSQLASGANTLTATYAGDTNYSSSSSTTTLSAVATKVVTQ